ncbi:linear amide C-N hydrolase [Psychromonas ossibalaenae]|uniref:linear amide C-N hydrolase n=1 Tax=Psychromonas ossibalaenae TaxID=444922 RepID=UPI00037CA81D|nr:linear amide C-N hydrolase [Psychromonas ossibalaenae]
MALLYKKSVVNTVLAAALTASALSAAQACSRVFWDTQDHGVFVARTMDWMVETDPTIDVRAKGISYRGAESGEKVLVWTSKYASIITTFYGKAGIDGFNEKGLAVNALYLGEESPGQYDKSKLQLENSRIVPYFLDNFSTVKEAAAAIKNIQLQQFGPEGEKLRGHYSLQDKSGDSAVLEFVDGKWFVYHGAEYDVLTNSPVFSEHLKSWQEKKPGSSAEINAQFPLAGNVEPAQRFIWNKYMLEQLKEPSSYYNGLAKIDSVAYKVPLDAANKIVNGKMTGYATQYTLVYNLEALELNMRYQYGDVYTQFKVDFNKLNDGRNYTLKADQQSNSGDMTSSFKQENGVMAQYRTAE